MLLQMQLEGPSHWLCIGQAQAARTDDPICNALAMGREFKTYLPTRTQYTYNTHKSEGAGELTPKGIVASRRLCRKTLGYI